MTEEPLSARMQKTVDATRKDLSKIRTGIASPAMLDNVMVDYYGQKTPVTQVANVTVPEPRQLAIKPWEKGLMGVIEKAILASDLGLNPSNDGTYIRLNLPPLTQDRRKELAKLARKIGEEGKVAIRNIRRDENEHIKKLGKEKNTSEDEIKEELDAVQQMTDKFIHMIDEVIAEKEKDIMTV